MKWLAIVVVAAAATVGGVATYQASERSTSPPAEANDRPIERESTIAGIGYVEPAGEIRRLGFKIDGRIKTCNVRIGSVAKAGDVLVRLDDVEERAAVDVAAAEIDAARASLAETQSGAHPDAIVAAEHRWRQAEHVAAFAEKEHGRLLPLIEKRSASPTDVDKSASEAKQTKAAVAAAKAEFERIKRLPRPEEVASAKARVRLAEAKLSCAQARLDQTVIKAPFSGTVLELLRRDGDVVRGIDQDPVLIFADVSTLRVRAEVDERFVHQLRSGLSAQVHGRPLGDAVHAGSVSFVKQLMGPKTVFSRAAAERVDLDVVQLFINMPPTFLAPVGLRVDVTLRGE